MVKLKRKYFFGWTNIKWFIKEIVNMYSAGFSFFSKKRLESGLAYLIAQAGMVFFLYEKHTVMSMSDMIMWVGAEFAVAGYMVHQIQKEKKTDSISNDSVNVTDMSDNFGDEEC